MVCKNPKNISLFCVIFLSAVFFSCQSLPKAPQAFLQESRFVPLDTGASVYIFSNVKQARQIIELLPIEELKDRQIRRMLDRTDFVAAAFFPPGSAKRFQLVTWGNYPSSRIRIAFRSNKNWKERTAADGYKYWHSAPDKLSIKLSSRQVFVLASLNDSPSDPVYRNPGAQIPEGFGDFGQAALLSCWIENPGPAISRLMNEAGVPLRFPVQKLFINFLSAGKSTAGSENIYEAVLRFQFDNPSQARGMAALLNLASGFVSDDQFFMLLTANPPVQNGNNLDIKTAPLGIKELSLLFEIISLY
ncbi:MAG: hypothetical protein FWD14_03725 [Treponema sp.]|nr:hypothetical protein [Treponema sp.]